MYLVRGFIGDTTSSFDPSHSYVTMVFMQYGGLLAVRNRRVSILQSNPLWGPRRNYAVPLGMIATALIAVLNLYGPGLQRVFGTAPIPGMFWGVPFSFALGILCMDEVRKLIVRTYPKVSLYSQPS
jgi:sodium/potassium-transporting ATPase subunit alpha